MEWISVNDQLPPENKYVIAKHNRGTWHDSHDQENVNTVVVKLIKGITQEERKKLEEAGDPRANRYHSEDEWSNNLKPYYWNSFGPDSFRGQNITHWMPIPKLEE